jgi:serine/threonine-protein kinase
VLISRAGTVKVADFGIAAVVDLDRTAPGGSIPGTLRYLAPEQAAGREATSASDLWAAGALLFELITGMPPSQGSGADLLRRRATEAPVPPSAVTADVPGRVDAIVMRACAVDPSQRFASASEMAAALGRAASELAEPRPLDELLDEVTGEIRLPDTNPTDFAPRNVRRIRRRRKHTMALAVLAALLLLGGARGVAALLAPEDVEVPSVTGLSKQQAAAAAKDVGLTTTIEARVNDFAPAGLVLSQDPAGGILKEGQPIALTISMGPPPLPVPTVVGMTLEVATVRLKTHQLEAGAVTRRFDVAVEGTVITQSPADGKLPWGEKVDLVVSRGPQSIGVPDVAGMTVGKAKEILVAAGFEVTVTDTYSDDIEVGRVIGTVPGGGVEAPEGSTIEIQKSIGPEFKELTMPDVRNMSLDAARAKLLGLGLRVSVQEVNSGCSNYTVVDSDPLPGQKVRENDLVALFVVC